MGLKEVLEVFSFSDIFLFEWNRADNLNEPGVY